MTESTYSQIADTLRRLYHKPSSHKFSEAEKDYLRRHLNKQEYRVYYAYYVGKYVSKTKIEWILDTQARFGDGDAYLAKKSHLKLFGCRPLTALEWSEIIINNYGTLGHQRFICHLYKHISNLIADDKYYGAVTPQTFIDYCLQQSQTLF